MVVCARRNLPREGEGGEDSMTRETHVSNRTLRGKPKKLVTPIAGEEWRTVVIAPDYFVSSRGRIVSTKYGDRRLLSTSISADTGYPVIGLRPVRGGLALTVAVHRLVLAAFVGPCPIGHVTAHLNGIRTDNHIENLAWVTAHENMAHKKLHGTEARGEQRPNAKLTADAVRQIRAFRGQRTQAQMAAMFGVTASAIQGVVDGKSWRHVQ